MRGLPQVDIDSPPTQFTSDPFLQTLRCAERVAADHGTGLALIVVLAPLPWLIPSAIHMVAGPEATDFWRFVITTAVIEACGLVSTVTVMAALAAAYRWIMPESGAVVTASGA